METAKILVIDDNPANLKLLRVLLLGEGYAVQCASSALQALARLDEDRPDLILTDVQLPDMNGLELTQRLKADPRSRNIPVVAVTAFAMAWDRSQALDAGCDAYVTKPIDTRALPVLLAAVLEQFRPETL